jgi:rhodanese-related sulfurtransferase/rubrerythrin
MQSLEMTSDQLRRYIREHHEKQYLIVDVRQPVEYRDSHIPGARLMPLPSLVRDMSPLPGQVDLIFYCHSGGRSAAAAAMAAEEADDNAKAYKTVYNLTGGMLAWQGGVVEDLPQVQLFEKQSFDGMLQTAMNLEKGALRFYRAVGGHYGQHGWSAVFKRLEKAEIAHAKSVFAILNQAAPQDLNFDQVFEKLPGEVLEGGMTLEVALRKMAAYKDDACMRLVELALQIERAAFDLYRALADQAAGDGGGDVFLSLAQAEKSHMQALIDHIAACR